jgi:hypothetical protein
MAVGTVERSRIGSAKRRSSVSGGFQAGPIVAQESAEVKRKGQVAGNDATNSNSKRQRRRSRRQSHGSAWHWKQTDCWYYTLPGCKKRVPLFDEDGNRIRGVDNKKTAQLAMARVKLGQGWQPEAPPASPDEWIVAKVCSAPSAS